MTAGDGRLHMIGAQEFWGASTWRVSIVATVASFLPERTRHDNMQVASSLYLSQF